MLRADAAHWGELETEYVTGKSYAKWKIVVYRGQKLFVDRTLRRLVNVGGEGRPLVLGIGAAGFALGGRGEQCQPGALIGHWMPCSRGEGESLL
jgi:hypothetical protein